MRSGSPHHVVFFKVKGKYGWFIYMCSISHILTNKMFFTALIYRKF